MHGSSGAVRWMLTGDRAPSAASLSHTSARPVPRPASTEPAAVPSQAGACCLLCSSLSPSTCRSDNQESSQHGCSARFGASRFQEQPTALHGGVTAVSCPMGLQGQLGELQLPPCGSDTQDTHFPAAWR